MWEKAASRNLVEGYYWLGSAYYYGKGVARNLQKALYWTEKAVEEGDEMASELLQLIKDYPDGDPNKPQKSGGCYVATAVYGSYDCPEVWTLRRFRDYTLAETWYGRAFIKVYYAISPTLVKWFGETKWFKALWKGKLDRLVNKLRSEGVEDTPYEDRNYR